MNAIEIRGLEKHYPGFDLRLDLDLRPWRHGDQVL